MDSFSGNKLICRSQYESPEVDGEIVVSLPEGVDPSDFPGKFIRVRITGADLYDLEAELI